MKLVIELVLLVFASMILLPSLVLWIECLFAPRANLCKQEPLPEINLKIAVLVPAHNEGEALTVTIESILPQLKTEDRLIVIADNCTDNTAQIARRYLVTVLERENQSQRGKGYALEYGLNFLESTPPDVVVAIDADCYVAPNTIQSIVYLAHQRNRPVQATYLMKAENPTVKDIISALAIKVKNLVRPLGLSALGCPNLLTGSGMAFPWGVIRQVSLGNSKTTDDMQLSVDLALAGFSPLYCSQGQVMGRLMEQANAISQRSRWEHGHIEMILTEIPRLLQGAIQQKRLDLVILALEIGVPPLSLLILLWAVISIITLVGGLFGLSWLPGVIAMLSGFLIFSAVMVAWAKYARQEVPITVLGKVIIYIVGKIPIYLAYLVNPQSRWLKTERE